MKMIRDEEGMTETYKRATAAQFGGSSYCDHIVGLRAVTVL